MPVGHVVDRLLEASSDINRLLVANDNKRRTSHHRRPTTQSSSRKRLPERRDPAPRDKEETQQVKEHLHELGASNHGKESRVG